MKELEAAKDLEAEVAEVLDSLEISHLGNQAGFPQFVAAKDSSWLPICGRDHLHEMVCALVICASHLRRDYGTDH